MKTKLLSLCLAGSALALFPSCTTVEAPPQVVMTTTTQTETVRTVPAGSTVTTRTYRTY